MDKDTILAEGSLSKSYEVYRGLIPPGYKEYKTNRNYMAKIGDWRHNKDEEIELDGIGGVNILVKADVHRAGKIESVSHTLVDR